MTRQIESRSSPGRSYSAVTVVGYTVLRYDCPVPIQSFANRRIETFFLSSRVPRGVGWGGLVRVVTRKLDMLHYAHTLADLRSPPGNRLEALRGDLRGYHSIRISDQWRAVFCWTDAGPAEVNVVDYHR